MISFAVFFLAIIGHEIGHILIAWYYSKTVPAVRFNKLGIKIIPKTIFNYQQKSIFLGAPIILGMIIIYPFINFFPVEGSLSMASYLISCGADFYNLILLEVKQ
jgi:hypothetical protein